MKLQCNLVRDFVSLYHDKEVSDESAKQIKKHLKTCEECRSYYKGYQVATPVQLPIGFDLSEIGGGDYGQLLKQIRVRRLVSTLSISVYVLASVVAMIVMGMKFRDLD